MAAATKQKLRVASRKMPFPIDKASHCEHMAGTTVQPVMLTSHWTGLHSFFIYDWINSVYIKN